MRKQSGLIASVLVLLAVIGALGAFALRRVRRRPGPGLASAPSGAIMVAAVDTARLRSLPMITRLRTVLGSQPHARAALAAMRARCGFDPIDRVDSVTLAIGPESLASYESGIVLVTAGRATAPEATRCFDALAHELGVDGPVGRPGSGRVYRLNAGGATPSASVSVAMTPGAMLAAAPPMLPRALAVLERRGASAERDPRLRAGLAALGGNPAAYAVVDLGTVIASTGATMEVASIFHDVIGSPALASVLGAETISLGLEPTAAGLRATSVVIMQNASSAQFVAPMFVQVLTAARSEFNNGATRAQASYLRRVAQAQTFEPGIASHVVPLQAAFDRFNALYDRIRVRADAATIRVELEISQSDLALLEAGVRAGVECAAALERTRVQRQGLPPIEP